MPLNKAQLFLYGDGAVILLAAGWLSWHFLFRHKHDTHFKDDIWKERAKQQAADAKIYDTEEKRDRRILLQQLLDEPEEERPKARTKDIPRPEPKAAPRKAEFQVPNFKGSAADILGVPDSAEIDLINRAYKHWIKRYHPDRVSHLGQTYVDQARRRAEQLNSARQEMLSRRKK
jgi:DnaJ-domain-containing protein 1